MSRVTNESRGFEEVASSVARSVIAIAIGKTLDGRPNIVGTGFAVEWPEYWVVFFYSC